MKLNEIRDNEGAHHRFKRLGRGSGSGKGKTSGKGVKGQKARAGHHGMFGFEGGQMPLHMRLPKLKGFKNPNKVEFQVVNLAQLGALFPDGGPVSVDDLVAAGAVRRNLPVKVLGNGDIGVAVQVSAHAFSETAKNKIVAAGGSSTELA